MKKFSSHEQYLSELLKRNIHLLYCNSRTKINPECFVKYSEVFQEKPNIFNLKEPYQAFINLKKSGLAVLRTYPENYIKFRKDKLVNDETRSVFKDTLQFAGNRNIYFLFRQPTSSPVEKHNFEFLDFCIFPKWDYIHKGDCYFPEEFKISDLDSIQEFPSYFLADTGV